MASPMLDLRPPAPELAHTPAQAAYVRALHNAGDIDTDGNEDDLIHRGNEVCESLHVGMTPNMVMSAAQGSGFNAMEIAVIVGWAQRHLCPDTLSSGSRQ